MLITWLKSVLQGAARARGQVEKLFGRRDATIDRPADWSQFEALQKISFMFSIFCRSTRR